MVTRVTCCFCPECVLFLPGRLKEHSSAFTCILCIFVYIRTQLHYLPQCISVHSSACRSICARMHLRSFFTFVCIFWLCIQVHFPRLIFTHSERIQYRMHTLPTAFNTISVHGITHCILHTLHSGPCAFRLHSQFDACGPQCIRCEFVRISTLCILTRDHSEVWQLCILVCTPLRCISTHAPPCAFWCECMRAAFIAHAQRTAFLQSNEIK